MDGTGISDRPTTIAPLKAVLIIERVFKNTFDAYSVCVYLDLNNHFLDSNNDSMQT